jgi:hypothetical protein
VGKVAQQLVYSTISVVNPTWLRTLISCILTRFENIRVTVYLYFLVRVNYSRHRTGKGDSVKSYDIFNFQAFLWIVRLPFVEDPMNATALKTAIIMIWFRIGKLKSLSTFNLI